MVTQIFTLIDIKLLLNQYLKNTSVAQSRKKNDVNRLIKI